MPHLDSPRQPATAIEHEIEAEPEAPPTCQRLLEMMIELSSKMDLLLERNAGGGPHPRRPEKLAAKGQRPAEHQDDSDLELARSEFRGNCGAESVTKVISDSSRHVSVIPGERGSRDGTVRSDASHPRSWTTITRNSTAVAPWLMATVSSMAVEVRRKGQYFTASAMDLMAALESHRQTAKNKPEPSSTRCNQLATDPRFDAFIISVVLFNAVMIWLQINEQAVKGSESSIYQTTEYICSSIFAAELMIRSFALGTAIFEKAHRNWAAVDSILVTMSIVDFILDNHFGKSNALARKGSTVGQILKVARIVRILRVFRMVRFLAKVRIMVAMIAGSLISLFWLFVLLVVVMYGFGIILTQAATEWRRPLAGPPPALDHVHEAVLDRFGTVFASMYTLFISISGGISWVEVADLTELFGDQYFVVFGFFIFFVQFSVLNIVTGVFVDGAIQQASNDRSLREMHEEEARRAYRDDLRELLLQCDHNGDGVVTQEEWTTAIYRNEVRSLMAAVEIKETEAVELFRMIDLDGNGQLTLAELMEGVERLRGGAQNLHIQELLWLMRKLRRLNSCIAAQLDIMTNSE